MSTTFKKSSNKGIQNRTISKDNGSMSSSSRFGSKQTTLKGGSKMTLQPTMQMSKLTLNKNNDQKANAV